MGWKTLVSVANPKPHALAFANLNMFAPKFSFISTPSKPLKPSRGHTFLFCHLAKVWLSTANMTRLRHASQQAANQMYA